MKYLDSSNFDETVAADVPVMVDFYADWCGPCKMIAPIVEAVARDYDGRAVVCKLDTDKAQDIAIRFGIRSIPAVLFFKSGELKKTVVGAHGKNDYVSALDALL